MSTLAHELANLYPDNDDARRIAFDADIPESDLNLDGTPINDWHNILVQACKRNKLERLVGVVQRPEEYPEKTDALNQALKEYRAQNPNCGRLGAWVTFVGDNLLEIIGVLLVAMISSSALDLVTSLGLLSKLAAGLGFLVILLTPFLLRQYLPMINVQLRRGSLWVVAVIVILGEAALFSAMTGAHLTDLNNNLPKPERKYTDIFEQENKYLHNSNFIEIKVLPDEPQQVNVTRDTDASPGPLHVFATVEISKTLAMPPFPRNYTGQVIYTVDYTCDLRAGNPDLDLPKLKTYWLKPGSMTLSWLIGFVEIPFLMDDDRSISEGIKEVVIDAVRDERMQLCPVQDRG